MTNQLCPGHRITRWKAVSFGLTPLYETHKLCASCMRYTDTPDSRAMVAPMMYGECDSLRRASDLLPTSARDIPSHHHTEQG